MKGWYTVPKTTEEWNLLKQMGRTSPASSRCGCRRVVAIQFGPTPKGDKIDTTSDYYAVELRSKDGWDAAIRPTPR